MSATNSISDLAAALQTITDSIATVSTSLKVVVEEMQKQQQVPVAESDELAPFHAWLQVELTPHFGTKGAKLISNQLNISRQKGDYRFFIPVYKKLVGEDLQKRQLLKTISAVYRYKFGNRYDRSALRSEIKYAKACPECGALAQVLVNRLMAEGLWK
jgi:hypothetical protein